MHAKESLRDWLVVLLERQRRAALVTVSKELQQPYGIPRATGRVIYNGVMLPERGVARSPLQPRPDVVIGWVGRLVPIKRVPLLLDAFALVAAEAPRVALWLIGDGPERAKVEDIVRHHNLGSRVRLFGHVEDVQSLYYSLDLFVLPSEHEGVPLALLDAMAHGVPALATDVGGIREVAGADQAVQALASADPRAWADSIRRLVLDPSQRAALGEAGKRRVEESFSLAASASAYAAAYVEANQCRSGT